MTQQYLNFLKRLYDDLKRKGIINKDVSTSKEKVQVVLDYAENLKSIQTNHSKREDYIQMIEELFVIKENDIPNEYFEHLSKMYLEEGHGHFDLVDPKSDLDIEMRKIHVKQIIDAQISSIDLWLEYFMSSDSNFIDMVYKIWALQGILDIGTLSKNLDGYNRRDKTTIAPFVNLDSELLGKSVLYLKMSLKEEAEDYPDEETKILASSGSFYQIYGKLLAKQKTIKLNGNEGVWVKYCGYNEEDALKLYNDLQGYNTGWCTASDRETAKAQVCGGGSYIGGDFYIYYTKDLNNEYKIPRLAIRMEQDKIGEIRGIAKNQNIEVDLEEVLAIKLKEFPDSEEYMKKVSDMKELTKIYKKNQAHEELTLEELIFLYEVDRKINGLGYLSDPRIKEIKFSRDYVSDINRIFANVENYFGKIDFLKDFINLKGVKFPKNVIIKITEYNCYGVDLSNLACANGVKLPECIVNGSLYLYELESVDGLILPRIIDGNLYLNSIDIKDLISIPLPEKVEMIYLKDGHYSLANLKDKIAKYKEVIELDRILEKNRKKEELTKEELIMIYKLEGSLSPVNSGWDFYYNESVIQSKINEFKKNRNLIKDANDIFNGSEIFEGNISFLSTLNDGDGLKFPKRVNGDIFLNKLISAKGVILPEYVNGALDLSSLVSAEGLVLPKYVEALYLNCLESTKGLELSEYVGSIVLSNIKSAENLIFPKRMNYLTLGIISAEGLVLPEHVEFNLHFLNLGLDDLLNVKLPDYVGGKIILKGFQEFTLDRLKRAINIKNEKLNLNKQMEILKSSKEQGVLLDETFKRGSINIWYILIPMLTILMGILTSYIINFFVK